MNDASQSKLTYERLTLIEKFKAIGICLALHYGIESRTFEPIKMVEGFNEVYKVTDMSQAVWIVKIHYDQFVTLERLHCQARFQEALRDADICASALLKTKLDDCCIMCHDMPMTVEHKMPNELKIWEENIEMPCVKSMAALLARIHVVSETVFQSNLKSGSQWGLFGLNLTNTLYDYDGISERIEAILVPNDRLMAQYHQIRNTLRHDWERLPKGIVHGDLGYYNLAFNGSGEVVGIFDFNLIGVEKYVNELVQTAFLNAYLIPNRTLEDPKGKEAMLYYIQCYRDIRPLNTIELDAMRLIFRLAFIAHYGDKMPEEIIEAVLTGTYDIQIS